MALSACKPKALYICTVYSQWSKPLPHEEAPAGSLMSPRFFPLCQCRIASHPWGAAESVGRAASSRLPRGCTQVSSAAVLRGEKLPPPLGWSPSPRPAAASPVPVPGGRDQAPCGARISAAKVKGSSWSLAAGTPRPRPGLLLGAAGGPRSSGVGALCAVRERPPTQPGPWGTGEGGPWGRSRSSAGGDRAARGWRERAPPPARAAPSVPQVRPPRLL